MNIYVNLLISTIITVVATFLIRKILEKKRPLLVAYLTTTTGKITNPTAEPPTSMHINTHTLIIRNPYNRLVKDVRVINRLPSQLKDAGFKSISDIITIFPAMDYEIKKVQNNDDMEQIVFAKLIPNQDIIITYMYGPNVLFHEFNIIVKSDEGFAKLVKYELQLTFPKWLVILLWSLIVIGSIVTINFILILIPKLDCLLKSVSCH